MSNKNGEKKQIDHMRKKRKESGGVPDKMWRELTKEDGHVPADVSVEELDEAIKKREDIKEKADEILEFLDDLE